MTSIHLSHWRSLVHLLSGCHFEECFLTSPDMSNHVVSQGRAVLGIGKLSKCLMTHVSWCIVRIQHGHCDSKPSLVAERGTQSGSMGQRQSNRGSLALLKGGSEKRERKNTSSHELKCPLCPCTRWTTHLS